MQERCGPAGHLSGDGRIKVGDDYMGLKIVQNEEMLKKPYYIKNSLKKGRLGRTIKAAFKFPKASGRRD